MREALSPTLPALTGRMPRFFLVTAIAILFVASWAARGACERKIDQKRTSSAAPLRIVSLAPNITETLYALGLGDKLVGVSRFCTYPPEAQEKPKIGGLYDPNYEAIVRLRPDLIVMLTEHATIMEGLEKLGIHSLVVRHATIDDILDSFVRIGDGCGAAEEGRRLQQDIQKRLETLEKKNASKKRPRVLVCVERTTGTGQLADIYIVGNDGFLNRIIAAAGGVNAYDGNVAFPIVSMENVMKMNPDVIVDLVGGLTGNRFQSENDLSDWKEVAEVAAVKNGRIFSFDQHYATVPGPRFIQIVEDLARILHPETEETHGE